jgi:hypothetical protein
LFVLETKGRAIGSGAMPSAAVHRAGKFHPQIWVVDVSTELERRAAA